MKELLYLNKYLVKYKWRLGTGILFVIISNIFAVIPAQVIRYAFDIVKNSHYSYQLFNGFQLQGELHEKLGSILLLFGLYIIILSVIKGVFMFLMRQTIIVMSRLVEFDLRNELYVHYNKLDLAFFKRNKTGDLMSRMTEDVSKIRMYLGPAIMYSINLVALFVIVIYMMLSVNVKLTVYVLLPLPILSISIYYVSNIINKKSEAIQRQLSNLTSLAQESYSGIRIIKSFVQGNSMKKYFEEESEFYRQKSLKLARTEALFFPLMLVLIGLSTILTIYVGGIEVIKGNITTGNIAEFVIYINMLTWPITSIGWVASLVQRAEASQKRINEFLKTEPDIKDIPTPNDINLQGGINIQFNNVTFTYPDTGITALKNFSLDVKQGEKIAILGKTGSGKSTLAELMVRLYDATEGEILLNGRLINNLELKQVRDMIGYVPQDVFLFSDSITNNIAFGEKHANKNRVEEAAQKASILNELKELPAQLDTIVGERGVTLSGGQKQRVSIARTLINDQPILVLDDCLSAVDTHTEHTIINNLKDFWKDKTVFLITHRLLSSIYFDKIVVLEDGKIAEVGTHNELLKINGLYKQLYNSQKIKHS